MFLTKHFTSFIKKWWDDIDNISLYAILRSSSSYLTFSNFSIFFINVGVRVSLRAPRLIPRALKLTTM
jgi:hypothetical protein